MAPLPPVPPTLCDGELVLRAATTADVEAIRQVYSEPDVRHWMGWDGELPDSAEVRSNIARADLAWREGAWAVFRVAVLPRDEVVGGAMLRFDAHEIAEVAYFLRRSARGRGLATRAVRLLSAWAFAELGIERLELRTHLENEASQRVAERAGFRREGVERASRAWPDGTRFESVVYSLLPEDRPRG
jgi:RimJ/RimL family protein N-acetyltransferase